MTIIAHISDTHFGTEVGEVVSAVKLALEGIKPEITILSGDITQRAQPEQFTAAKQFFDSLPGEVKIAIPGNHDIPLYNVFARFLMPYNNYKETFGPRENAWSNGKLGIVAVDATSPYRHTHGKIRNEILRKNLQKIRQGIEGDGLLMAVAHQPLLTALPEDVDEVLIGAGETAKILEEFKVDIVLSGHVHFPIITTTKAAFPNLQRHFILAGAGTAVSRRIRSGAPNSFNIINFKNAFVEVTKYEFEQNALKFVAHAPCVFGHRADGGWCKV